jgi:hypothetical protein
VSASGFDHAVIFTGHMIDAPGRKVARFPARAEGAARDAIRTSLRGVIDAQSSGGTTVGIAGGASGGDLLFHEKCNELSIPTLLRLALPIEQYIEASVAPAGGDWMRRFHALIERLGPDAVRVLDDSVVLPESLTGGAELNIWQRTNLWMVDEAIAIAPQRTLLALWDGEAGDGPGGTEHLVKAAPGFGIDVAPIMRTQGLFDPAQTPSS